MRDGLALAVIALLVLGAATAAVGAVCVAAAAARAVRRLIRPGPRRRTPSPLLPVPQRYVWLACHTPRCGHLETEHYPAGPGRVVCHRCGTVRDRP
ncbi:MULTISPECIES: hypothetical protein [unclassified Streptomyces]|uniref:hypothetical protein n=1 Tax=unclassified Streptomyces TaxID=2593676 RepID=UPI00166012C5|nr:MULTISPECIES: hypothetical protein [unclassified Streptomyces]MBD0707369.1 hypothetical protein [Streptomyces sp. CBMA291]MBD0715179.1 hypothetical protein [Streptomyces sp. CBMA370]